MKKKIIILLTAFVLTVSYIIPQYIESSFAKDISDSNTEQVKEHDEEKSKKDKEEEREGKEEKSQEEKTEEEQAEEPAESKEDSEKEAKQSKKSEKKEEKKQNLKESEGTEKDSSVKQKKKNNNNTEAISIELAGGGEVEAWSNNVLSYALNLEVSGNDTVLKDYVAKIEFDKEFVDSITLSKPEQADKYEIVEEGDKKVIYVHFPYLTGGTIIEMPLKQKFKTKVNEQVPKNYELPITASVLDEDQNTIVKSNEIMFKPIYKDKKIAKSTDPFAPTGIPGILIIGIEDKQGNLLQVEDPFRIKYTFNTPGTPGPQRASGKIILKDTLPEGATFDPEINPGWTLSEDGKTATKVKGNGNSSVTIHPTTDFLILDFPDPKDGQTVENKVEATYVPLNQKEYEEIEKDEATVKRTFETRPYNNEKEFRKSASNVNKIEDNKTEKEKEKVFFVSITPDLDQFPLKNIVIDDFKKEDGSFALDERMEFVRMRKLQIKGLKGAKLYAYTGENGENKVEIPAWPEKDIEFPEETVGYRIEIDEVPAGERVSVSVYVKFKNPEEVSYVPTSSPEYTRDINTLENTAKAEYEYYDEEKETSFLKRKTKDSAQYYLIEYKESLKLSKETKRDSATSPRIPDKYLGETVEFDLTLDYGDIGERELKNLTLVDLLPTGLTYEKIEIFAQNKNADIPTGKNVEVIENYKNTGRTAIIVQYDELNVPKKSSTYNKINMKVYATVNSLSDEGINTNEVYFTAEGLEGVELKNSGQDKYDINEDGDSKEIISYNTSDYNFLPAKEVYLKKYIRTDQTAWNAVGLEVQPSEEIEYRLNLKNLLDQDVDHALIYDILPYEGDLAIVENQEGDRLPRGSKFSNVLQGPVTPVDGFTVSYTTDDPSGTTQELGELNWTENPSDYSKVTAIKIEMQEGRKLKSKESVNFEFSAKTPDSGKDYQDFRGKNSGALSINGGNGFVEGNKVYNEIPRQNGQLKILKKDGKNDSPLSHAKFDIHYVDGETYEKGLTTDKNGVIEITEIPYGKYVIKEVSAPENYVLDETEVEFTIDKENENIELSFDNYRLPTIKKDVEGQDEYRVPRDQTYKYNVSLEIPEDIEKYKRLEIFDLLDDRLEYVYDENEGINSGWSILEGNLTKDQIDFTKDGQKLTWAINDEGFEAIDPGEEFVITFQAKIKGNAKLEEEEKGIPNKAILNFDNNRGGTSDPKNPPTTPPVIVTPEEGSLEILKVDQENHDVVLEDARFKLSTDLAGENVVDGKDTIIMVNGEEINDLLEDLRTQEDGTLIIEGLTPGTYYLHEIKAPTRMNDQGEKISYQLLDKPVEIQVLDQLENDVEPLLVENKQEEPKIPEPEEPTDPDNPDDPDKPDQEVPKESDKEQSKDSKLPKTGEIDYTWLGIALLIIGLVLLFRKIKTNN